MPDYEEMFWVLLNATRYAIWQLDAGFPRMARGTLSLARDICKDLYDGVYDNLDEEET